MATERPYLVYTDVSADAADLEARLAPATGWETPTGEVSRLGFGTTTATLQEIREHLGALIIDLLDRGNLAP